MKKILRTVYPVLKHPSKHFSWESVEMLIHKKKKNKQQHIVNKFYQTSKQFLHYIKQPHIKNENKYYFQKYFENK